MNPLKRLWNAFALLAAALEGLAATADAANVEARNRLGLGNVETSALPHVEEETPAKKRKVPSATSAA